MKPLLTTSLAMEIDAALTPERPCEGRREHITPATWWAVPSCGCGVFAYCGACHDVIAEFLAEPRTLMCKICQTEGITMRFELIA